MRDAMVRDIAQKKNEIDSIEIKIRDDINARIVRRLGMITKQTRKGHQNEESDESDIVS